MRVRLFGLQPGQQYAVQLRSNNGEAVSDWSQRFEFTAQDDQTIPAAPTGLFVNSHESTAFHLNWDDITHNTDGSDIVDLDHYDIYLRSAIGEVAVLESKQSQYTFTLEENMSLFGISDQVPAHVLHCKVRAVDQFGHAGAYCAEVTEINDIPPKVSSCNAVGMVDSIRFQWTPPSNLPEDFKEYYVHMVKDTGGGIGTKNFTTGPGNLVWVGRATNLVYQTTDYSTDHYFKVMIHDAFNNISNDDSADDVDHARPNDDGAGGGGHSRPPSGPAGGDLEGTYPNPSIKTGAVDHTKMASGTITPLQVNDDYKDGLASDYSLRTLGTGPRQATAGNDSRLSDSRAPTGSAGGDLSGTYPNPGVAKIKGVSISGTAPTTGQVLTATGTSGAAWADPTGGGGGGITGVEGTVAIDCGGSSGTSYAIMDCGGSS